MLCPYPLYLAASRGAGIVIGTGIGGLLAQPALMYPTIFSPTGVFAKYVFCAQKNFVPSQSVANSYYDRKVEELPTNCQFDVLCLDIHTNDYEQI